jgi:hypothetical protein
MQMLGAIELFYHLKDDGGCHLGREFTRER